MHKIYLVFTLLTSFFSMANEVGAPYGFKWGISPKAIKEAGVVLNNCERLYELTSCITSNPSKKLGLTGVYSLDFYDGYGLQSVSFTHKNPDIKETNNIQIEQYEKLSELLTRQLGKPTLHLKEQYGFATRGWRHKNSGSVSITLTRDAEIIVSHTSKNFLKAKESHKQKSDSLNVDAFK